MDKENIPPIDSLSAGPFSGSLAGANTVLLSRTATAVLHSEIINDGVNGLPDTIFGHSKCPICDIELELTNLVISKPCGHTTCITCLVEHLKYKDTCHTCREDILSVYTSKNKEEEVYGFQNRYILHTPMKIRRINTHTSYNQSHNGVLSNSRERYHNILHPSVPLMSPLPTLPTLVSDNIELPDTVLLSLHKNTDTNGIFFIMPTTLNNDTDIVIKNSDTVIIDDVSGSMDGSKNELCKKAINKLIDNSTSTERYTVISFDDYAVQEFALQSITPFNKEDIKTIISRIDAHGTTDYQVAFSLLYDVIRESGNNRKKTVIFLTDGEPTNNVSKDLLDKIYGEFPDLTMYIISIGNQIDASSVLVPILHDRGFELGRYFHWNTDLEVNLSTILSEIQGSISDTFATDVKIIFTNAKPVCAHVCTEDGKYIVNIPILNYGDSLNIAYTNVLTDHPVEISYQFKKNDDIIYGVSTYDSQNILPESLTKFFIMKKIIMSSVDTILEREDINNDEKHALLIQIKTDINRENHTDLGIYFDEINSNLDIIISSLDNRNLRDLDSQNTATAVRLSSNSNGIGRIMSNTVSRTASQTSPSSY